MSQQQLIVSAFVCDKCGRRFKRACGLGRHKLAENRPDTLTVCKICRLVLPVTEYRIHTRNCKLSQVVREVKYIYECQIWNAKFMAMLTYHKHPNAHVPSNRYHVHLDTDTVELIKS